MALELRAKPKTVFRIVVTAAGKSAATKSPLAPCLEPARLA